MAGGALQLPLTRARTPYTPRACKAALTCRQAVPWLVPGAAPVAWASHFQHCWPSGRPVSLVTALGAQHRTDGCRGIPRAAWGWHKRAPHAGCPQTALGCTGHVIPPGDDLGPLSSRALHYTRARAPHQLIRQAAAAAPSSLSSRTPAATSQTSTPKGGHSRHRPPAVPKTPTSCPARPNQAPSLEAVRRPPCVHVRSPG